MAGGASRIFNIMKHAGTDTISETINLRVSSISPLTLTDGDRLFITGEFCIFNSEIELSQIRVGDTFTALTFDNGQTYYINEVNSSTNELMTYNRQIATLQSQVADLQRRVTALEQRE